MIRFNSNIKLKIAAKLLKKPDISLIICTHNRAKLLDKVLPYYKNLNNKSGSELIVVLNACTDDTTEIIAKHASENFPIHAITEDKIGHCNARNAGWRSANAPWVVYIDDDAYPSEDLLDEIRMLIQNNSVAAFSGHAKFWQDDSPAWIIPEFVEVPQFSEQKQELPTDAHMNGCICGFKVSELQALNGFDPKLGMKGKQVGYADEVDIQLKLQAKGLKILYDPYLVVYHRSHFSTSSGFINSAFQKGRFAQMITPHQKWKHFIKLLLSSLIAILLLLPKSIQYGWSSAVVRTFSKPAYHYGRCIGG